MKVIEVVPNISEGRDSELISLAVSAIVGAGTGETGPVLLDTHVDPDHNRSVFTVAEAGPGGDRTAEAGPGLSDSILQLAAVCVDKIDLSVHSGVHPRMGALDVVPFVPLRDATMADAVELARSVGAALWSEFAVPVYLYGHASTRRPDLRLPSVRIPFEKLASEMAAVPPDIGDARPNRTAGAAAVGARNPMVAFNIWIDVPDARESATASMIASDVRESGGGPPGVRALGFYLPSRAMAQVSMNLTEPELAGVGEAFEAVRSAAARHGAGVLGGELVGLVPAVALAGCSRDVLEACEIGEDQVLESRLAALGW